jgi:hypothetical protein
MIDRVVVDATAAISKTTAGKIQIAQDLLQSGLIRNTREYLTVVNTGELEPLYESEMSEILLVRAENEDLRSGKVPQALVIDDPKLHVLEHRAILANPDSRRDAQLVQNVLNHIQQHLDIAETRKPGLLAILGEQQLPGPTPPAPPPPMGMPPMGQNPMAQHPPMMQHPQQHLPGGPHNHIGLPHQVAPVLPGQQQAQQIRMPNMPNMPHGTPGVTQQAYEQMMQGVPHP